MSTHFDMHCVRYSGIRLKSSFAQSSTEIDTLAGKVMQAIPGMGIEIQKHPVLVDDNLRNLSERNFWALAIQQGEVILCSDKTTKQLLGVAFLRDIKYGASVEMNVFAMDAAFGAVASEVIQYIFHPLGLRGLGALKIRLRIHPDNSQALVLAQGAGFTFVAELVAEACYHTRPVRMILAELLNSAKFSTGETINGSSEHGDASGSGNDVQPVSVHNGPGDGQLSATKRAVGGDWNPNWNADELLSNEFVGNPGVHSASGGTTDPSPTQERSDAGDTGGVKPATNNRARNGGRPKSTRVAANKRRAKSRKP
jgi:hypothetical protein